MDRRGNNRPFAQDENNLGSTMDFGESFDNDDDDDGGDEDDDRQVESADIQSLLNKVAELNEERAGVAGKYAFQDSNSETSSQFDAPLTREHRAVASGRVGGEATPGVNSEVIGILKSFTAELQALSEAVARLDDRLNRLELVRALPNDEDSRNAASSSALTANGHYKYNNNHRRDRRSLERLFEEQTQRTESFLRRAAAQLDPGMASSRHLLADPSPLYVDSSARRSALERKRAALAAVAPPTPFLPGLVADSKNSLVFRDEVKGSPAAASPASPAAAAKSSWHTEMQVARIREEIAALDESYRALIDRGAEKSARGIAHLAQIVEQIESKRLALEVLLVNRR